MKIRCWPLLVMLTASCSWLGTEPAQEVEPTLADLQPARLPDKNQNLPSVTIDELIRVYRDVSAVTTDPATKIEVAHRLADLELLRGEQNLETGSQAGNLFATAISAYQQLIAESPENPSNDKLMYQLSKAYDLDGKPEQSLAVLEQLSQKHKGSEHWTEVEFRKGETYFSQGQYDQAEQAYANVISAGDASPYYQNALYMHGWSQFKRNRYRASIASFTETLDRLVPSDNQLDSLPRGDRELAEDSLRVLSVVFSYLDGADTINEVYQKLGERHYTPLLYTRLGDLYASQERYRDSADVYLAYANRYPDADDTHQFYVKVIETYKSAGFAQDVLLEKQRYVDRFGVKTAYWQYSNPLVQGAIEEHLQQYIVELATYYHALAQTERKKNPGDASSAALTNYRIAGDYYQNYVESFPADAKASAMAYLLGDTRLESKDYRAAIAAYELVAYQYKEDAKAADAGYAIISTYDLLLANTQAEQKQLLLAEKVNSELRFAQYFESDPRAMPVQLDAANTLLKIKQYDQAAMAADRLVNWPVEPDRETLTAAWLIIGHSQFELGDFMLAENAYRQSVDLMTKDDPRLNGIIDRIAASIYKQAEQLLASGSERHAADEFMRVIEVAPNSSIRVNAQFDAATHYLAAQEWSKAADLLVDFRRRFAGHALAAGVSAKLIVAYQQLGQQGLAADELLSIYATEQDPEAKRQALYQAAVAYQASGNDNAALNAFRDYAHAYPQPFDLNIEAMATLSEIYQKQGEDGKRRYWLQKIIAVDAGAKANRTERSRYLAAQASTVFADDAYQAFKAIKLTLPIKTSLKKKKAALNKVLAAYQATNNYGIQEFATMAGFRIGEIYRQLSKDLLNSERPAGLDELALEQYEVLLEEQAYPFEEKAIDIHEKNVQRSWSGSYDSWVQQSIDSLARLLPARYGKTEAVVSISEDIY